MEKGQCCAEEQNEQRKSNSGKSEAEPGKKELPITKLLPKPNPPEFKMQCLGSH
jgi:hypothetical protein